MKLETEIKKRPESLTKDKIGVLNDRVSIIWEDDVRSAVEWALKEIDKNIEDNNNKSCKHYDFGLNAGLKIAKEIIRRAFEGVIE